MAASPGSHIGTTGRREPMWRRYSRTRSTEQGAKR
jgi:hypothetical protein